MIAYGLPKFGIVRSTQHWEPKRHNSLPLPPQNGPRKFVESSITRHRLSDFAEIWYVSAMSAKAAEWLKSTLYEIQKMTN